MCILYIPHHFTRSTSNRMKRKSDFQSLTFCAWQVVQKNCRTFNRAIRNLAIKELFGYCQTGLVQALCVFLIISQGTDLINDPLRFAKFQELIAVQTGVSAAQQKLMFKYEEFRPDPMAPASSYPNTSVSGESQRERKTSF